jgi:hypothetical protein
MLRITPEAFMHWGSFLAVAAGASSEEKESGKQENNFSIINCSCARM